MSNADLAAAARNAVQISRPHTDPKAAQIATLQAAIATGTTQDIEISGTVYRFTPDGNVLKVTGGVETPAPDRIVARLLADLGNANRMRIWSETAVLPHMSTFG